LLLLSVVAVAADGPAAPFVGRPVAEVIDEFRDSDLPFAYSTILVTPDLVVLTEPNAAAPLEIVKEILRPHGLTIRTDSGVHLVVRDTQGELGTDTDDTPASPAASDARPMESVIVSASRYAISRDIAASKSSFDQRTIQNLPDIGEDPIRAAQRLPGAAASGASAVAHFRGGEANEIGIMLNGQWLFDPFHIRDYQNIFSAIDARAIEGIEVYTGGFPVRYGDRMSGLVLMDSIETEDSRHSEIGLSVFNTSLLTSGTSGKKSWLFSARRGNLDLVIKPAFGQPSYFDVFGEFSYEITPRTRVSFNALYANDAIELVLEVEPSERDQVVSDTKNAQFWVRLDSSWSDTLSSSMVLSSVDYFNRRSGFANDSEKMVATVEDNREIKQVGFRQDWLWNPNDRHWTQWGISATNSEARYVYDGNAQYFGLQARYANQPQSVSRTLSASPEGGSYAVYFSDRWRLTDRSTVEWGLRWDDQTYTGLSSDSQLSPRLSYLYRLGEKTDLRVSVGRYYQSQPIQSLQVEDGVTNFWPAQRADHVVFGAQHLFASEMSMRLELFYKDIGQVRPRFENLFDPLGLMPELQQDRVRLDPSSARSRGVELSLDQRLGQFGWWASYTWSNVTDEINGVDVRRSWDQTHALQAGMDWKNERWNFSAAANVHTGWPTTELMLNNDGSVSPGPRNATRHGTFASLDMRLSRTFDVRRGTLLAFIEVSNILNRRNHCCIDWDFADGPNGEEVLERGQDYWMPLVPAIGILWEF
jgi:outer membrane receptor protein involved in Fe transport